MSLAFMYNDSGLRTHKTVTQNGVTTTYTYAWSQDGRLISQSDGTRTLYFIYDTNDEIIGFAKLTADTSEFYYYVKNLQGDVYAIVDSNGTVVAEYLYDAWGYLLEITGSQATTLGVLNPIRYRGYYYDTETGYYYLQSRYYDPLWGRFINADEYAHTGFTVLSTNMYAYCENNPIKFVDFTGKSVAVIVGTAVLSFVFVYFFSSLTLTFTGLVSSVAMNNPMRTIVNSARYQEAINTFATSLDFFLKMLGVAIKSTINSLKNELTKALNKAKFKTKTSKTARHHIIARTDSRAKEAREIWEDKCKWNINAATNLVAINQNLHYHVHTTVYHQIVGQLVKKAYDKADKKGVLAAVGLVRTMLTMLSESMRV